MSHIVFVGDDGHVYDIDTQDLQKIVKQVPVEKLSNDAKSQAHSQSTAASTGASHIFVTKSDIFVASKSDIFIAERTDALSHVASDIFVAPKGS